jgi:hypothetical protein
MSLTIISFICNYNTHTILKEKRYDALENIMIKGEKVFGIKNKRK